MNSRAQAHAIAGRRCIVWLASYPKSGNTWARLLLANFLGGRPVGIAQVGAVLPTFQPCNRAWFETTTGLSSSACSENEVDALRPAAIRAYAAEIAGSRRFGKVHDALHETAAGEPLLPECVAVGAVYLVRNPLDVTVSYAHYFGLDPAAALRRVNDSCHVNRGDGPLLHERVLDWSSHVESWLAAEFPVLMVRYEDMLADTVRQLARMAGFLGLPGAEDEQRLRRAVQATDFRRLQEQEAQHGFAERPPTAQAFFRSGRDGDWRQHLTADQAREIARRHARLMLACGYDAQAGNAPNEQDAADPRRDRAARRAPGRARQA